MDNWHSSARGREREREMMILWRLVWKQQTLVPTDFLSACFPRPVRLPPILRARLTVSTARLPRLPSSRSASRTRPWSRTVPTVSQSLVLGCTPCPATGFLRCALAGDQRWTDFHLAAAPRGIAASALFGASALCGLPPPTSPSLFHPGSRLAPRSILSLRSMPPISLSRPPAPRLAVLVHPLSGPHPRIVGWHGIPCGTTPFRGFSSGLPSSSRRYSACQHRRRRENRYYGEINMIGRRMPRYPYT